MNEIALYRNKQNKNYLLIFVLILTAIVGILGVMFALPVTTTYQNIYLRSALSLVVASIVFIPIKLINIKPNSRLLIFLLLAAPVFSYTFYSSSSVISKSDDLEYLNYRAQIIEILKDTEFNRPSLLAENGKTPEALLLEALEVYNNSETNSVDGIIKKGNYYNGAVGFGSFGTITNTTKLGGIRKPINRPQYIKAAMLTDVAIFKFRSKGKKAGLAESLLLRGLLYKRAGDLSKAFTASLEAKKIFKTINADHPKIKLANYVINSIGREIGSSIVMIDEGASMWDSELADNKLQELFIEKFGILESESDKNQNPSQMKKKDKEITPRELEKP
jgi:hypothetical protein